MLQPLSEPKSSDTILDAAVTVTQRCFVISPIGAEGSPVRRHADDVFDYIIKPAVDECGLVALRSDHLLEPGKISEQMFREIVTNDCCVALLTGHNPNVFYELAVAQTVGTPVVALIEKGESIPFDIQDLRCVRYDLSPRPLFDRVYVKELVAHLARLGSGGWQSSSIFGNLTALRLARTGMPTALVAEMTCSWVAKRNALSERQRSLLKIMEQAEGRGVGQDDIATAWGCDPDDDGIYYRLEHLRLLGLLEKSQGLIARKMHATYSLSAGYRAALAAEKQG